MTIADSLLDRRLYSFPEVDRLLALSSGTARRWINGYDGADRHYAPVLRPFTTDEAQASWGELVECRLLAEYRSAGVAIQRLRPAVQRLREEFGDYPLAHAQPFLIAEGRELVRIIQDEVELEGALRLVVVRNDQLVLSPAIERFQMLAEYDDEGRVTAIHPSRHSAAVVIDPGISFGLPVVRGVRTDLLAQDFTAGSSQAELARLYDLTEQQVEDAIRYELAARTPAA